MELYLNQMQNERYEIEVTRSYSKKQGTSYHRYCNDILTFDIETTSAWLENGKIKGYETGHDNEYWNNLTPLALCYIWQFSFNDKVYYGRRIEEFKKVNKIMGVEFTDRMNKVVDEYNNRRRDEAFANEVLDDVAEQLAKLLEELKKEKDSFKGMGIDYEEKAFYDILKAVAKKYEFEYPDDKMIELSKQIKIIVDDKAKYTDWSTRDDIKANLQVDLILLLDEFDYPPVTIDDVYKEVLEQAENFKKYAQ